MSRASSSSCAGIPEKIQLLPVGRKHRSKETTKLRIARLPTLVAAPPDGDLRLVAAVHATPTTESSSVSTISADRSGMSSRDAIAIKSRATAIESRTSRGGAQLLQRERTAPKVLTKESDEVSIRSVKDAIKRYEQLPQMIPNVREKPVRVGKVELSGYRLPQPHELPPLQNHQNHSIDKGLRKARLTPVQLRSMNFAEMENGKIDEKSTIIVPRLALRGPTPDPEIIHLVPTPPPSDRDQILTEEVGVQTDDNFDTDNAQILKVLADSAIRTASAELEVERLRKELSEERRMQEERDLSRSLAIETCNEVMLSSIEHLNELQAPPSTKSVGVDTKAFTRRLRNLDLLTVELEQDFFPWLFAKADRMFSRKMTSRQLDKDAMDSDDRIGSFGRQASNCLVLIRRDTIGRSDKFSTI